MCHDKSSVEAAGMYQESPVPLLSDMPVPGSLSEIKQLHRAGTHMHTGALTHTHDMRAYCVEPLVEIQSTVR